MRTRVLVPALFLIAAVSGEGAERARLEISRAPKPPVIDGVLDDEAWQSPPLALSDWITYNPLNGEKLPQRTEVHAKRSNAHLGYVFPDPKSPTGQRYVVYSAAFHFVPVEELKDRGYKAYASLFDKKVATP